MSNLIVTSISMTLSVYYEMSIYHVTSRLTLSPGRADSTHNGRIRRSCPCRDITARQNIGHKSCR
jgi:hypothetical protein